MKMSMMWFFFGWEVFGWMIFSSNMPSIKKKKQFKKNLEKKEYWHKNTFFFFSNFNFHLFYFKVQLSEFLQREALWIQKRRASTQRKRVTIFFCSGNYIYCVNIWFFCFARCATIRVSHWARRSLKAETTN